MKVHAMSQRGWAVFSEWKDTRKVLMCSTFYKAYGGDTLQRCYAGLQQVHGGVDLSNALIGYYKVLQKTQKWYWSFFYHFVNIAVANAFILHQHMARASKEKNLTQKALGKHLFWNLQAWNQAQLLIRLQMLVATTRSTLLQMTALLDGESARFAIRRHQLCVQHVRCHCVFGLNMTVTMTGMSRVENINHHVYNVRNVFIYMLYCSKHSNLTVVPEMFPSLGGYIRPWQIDFDRLRRGQSIVICNCNFHSCPVDDDCA